MDTTVVDLATKTIGILLPFFTKSAEEIASKFGDAAFEKAKSLLSLLKEKFSGDQEATESLVRFEEKPERYQLVFEDILLEKLTKDNDLVIKLSYLLQTDKPDLEVIQAVEEGKSISGVKAKVIRKGRVKISQEVTRAENVIGAEFETLG